ncbi:hypothetical protein DYU05_10090 [Mucilaginibacter terrenus]|uniref:Uncharacterized protein n=1 Tax=Mucilaginibacter terrenus TaxID=2482727 RepID=A0A3E2NYB1_9SPHI|nr:hypothetical protein [Mucilaginibacter terrenus]RFZ85911.1 hypothetical protein DYU05_10090 [Mucilaginibacter terrenus]
MFNWFKSNPAPEFEIKAIGTFYQQKISGYYSWEKAYDIFSIGQEMLLTIYTGSDSIPTPEQVSAVQVLRHQYNQLIESIFSYLIDDERSSLTVENFKQLYALIEITLNENSRTWTYTFESPHESRFLRVIIEGDEVIDFYED